MNVLGLKIEGHDPGASLIAGGRIVAIAEERLNRVKHSQGIFPKLSIDYCLSALAVSDKEIDLIVIDHTSRQSGGNIERMFRAQMGERFSTTKIEVISHHNAHAASAFLCSPFMEAAVLVYDGRGSMVRTEMGTQLVETESLMRGEGSELTTIDKWYHALLPQRGTPFLCGIGMFYDQLCVHYLSLGKHNHGKMMGLAAYGDDSFLKRFPYEKWMTERNGELVLNGDWRFAPNPGNLPRLSLIASLVKLRNYVVSLLRSTVLWLTRQHEVRVFEQIVFPRPARNPSKDTLPDKYYSSVAYMGQKVFERFAVELGQKLKTITKSENLCVSGGCALNIDANRNFLTEVGFKNLFVQPASSDCGIALGCALWGYHIILKQPRNWVMKSTSLGRPYTTAEIDEAIEKRKDEIEWRVSPHIAKETAQLIANNNIVGWFQGGSEYGPRALGNRSILCDARNKDMRDVLNKRVKHREMWRPFATSILAEKLGDWFDLQPNATTAFMLLCGTVHEHKRTEVPSIVHVDNTCRMQTLTKEDNGIYYDLVKEFENQTGVPLVLNTSFNLGGDPIVETPYDALDTFLHTDMDYLVLEDRIIQKRSS